ncbi:MAG TPA: SHOCT domain-containing protein [Burkholderiales bacterium]
MWGGDMMGWGGGWGWSIFGLVHMVLWWLLIILGIVVLAKWLFGSSSSGGGSSIGTEDRALAILRERYARGEIDKTEFEARKRDLTG